MKAKHFVLTSVRAVAPAILELVYADGACLSVDLAPIIRAHKVLAPLREPATFASAHLVDHGHAVAWEGSDLLELAADNLRARAIEQAGGYSHELIYNWMARHQLTLDDAAQALGLSRRMLAYYRSGQKPVPRTVALACRGREVEKHGVVVVGGGAVFRQFNFADLFCPNLSLQGGYQVTRTTNNADPSIFQNSHRTA